MKQLLIVALFLSAAGAYADIVIPPQFETKVKCTTLSGERSGKPSDAAITNWIAKVESSESLSAETKSVSVSALGKNKFLVCATYRAENPQ